MQSIYYKDIKTIFSRICPDFKHEGKESTIEKQSKHLDPPGLTIAAMITGRKEEQPFREVIKKVQTNGGKTLCSNKFLHFTLLGIFNDERKCPDSKVETNSIIKTAKDFIEQKEFGPITIKFNLVRPGAFYDKGGRPCDCNSDGTLVAMTDIESPEITKFNILGDDLACHLRNSFPVLFYPNIDNRLKREHPTVWSTLGYFNEPDFDIDERLASILEELKSFDAIVTVSQLEVRSYKLRSLKISDLKTAINL
ncbi:MAG: hypothetical protein ACRD8Z_23755 [Nitrososphaeraceae archaeon]